MNAIGAGLEHPLVVRLGWCLVHSVWEIAAVALVAATVLRILRRGNAQGRYLAACAALVAMAVLPVVTLASTWGFQAAVQASLPVGSLLQGIVPTANGPAVEDKAREPRKEEALIQVEPPRAAARIRLSDQLEPWLPLLVASWGLGVVLLSIRLLGGWILIQSLTRKETRPVKGPWVVALERLSARLRLRQAVRLLESARVQVPMVVGWWRPVILLPATAVTGLSSDQLTLILGHELAHILRQDYLVNMVQSLIETLLFYHPAVWWISARIREERENCCDDRAVALCGSSLEYARALTALESLREGSWSLAPSARGGSLLVRIRRIMGVEPAEEAPARGLAGTLTLTTVAFLGLVLLVSPGTAPARASVADEKVVTGRVATPDGKAVAGADVWLVSLTYPEPKAIVLRQGRTDEAGRFRLIWDEKPFQGRFLGSHALWAHLPGFGPTHVMFHESWNEAGADPDHPITLTIAPAAATRFRILDPAGNPAAGVRVTVVSLNQDRTSVPDDLAERLAVATDQEGRATLTGAPCQVILTVQVTSRDHGIQRFSRENGFQGENELKLVPLAAVEGHLTADDPAVIRGVRVHLEGTVKVEEGVWTSSLADVITDDQGRFSVPGLVAGYVHIEAVIPDNAIYRQASSENNEFEGAKKIEFKVPLERLVKVHGVVREKGTGKPVESAGIRFSNARMVGPIILVGRTDGSGRFEAIAPRGKETFCLLDVPKGYLKLLRGIEMPEITRDGQELPPIELERGVTLRGIVVDEMGKPVDGARVLGRWSRFGSAVMSPIGGTMTRASGFSATAKSDDHGEFLLEGIHAGANVVLQAEAGEARTEAPLPAAAGLPDPVKLVISGVNTVSLQGRVVDSTGKPVPEALVQIRSRPLEKNTVPDPGVVPLGGETSIFTDRKGHFETPHWVRRGFEYRAEVKPDDQTLMSDSSPWLVLRAGTRPALQDVVLRRLRIAEGRVVDSRGEPIADARVRQSGDGPVPTEARSDSAGHFRLPGVVAEPAFVFVEKQGYRFTGQSIRSDSTTVTIVLQQSDGAAARPMKMLPPALSREQELKLLHLIFDPYAEQVLKQEQSPDRFMVLRILTQIDPVHTRERLQREAEAGRKSGLYFHLQEVADELFKQSPNEALDMIAAVRDPDSRSYLYRRVSLLVADSDRARKLSLLNESLLAARGIVDPTERVLRLAEVGQVLMDMGEVDQGAKLLREAQPVGIRLPVTGRAIFARAKVAAGLVVIDCPAALELLKGTEEDREHDRYIGHIAHRLAGKNPGEAERVLMMMRDGWPHFRDVYTQRVCYRMVTVDPDRAMKLARGMTDYGCKARALGAMALALAQSRKDRVKAAALLNEALGMLEQVAAGNQDLWNGLSMACTAAAGLLPIVEQVDPSLVRECLWRTLAMRPPLRSGDSREGIPLIAGSRVAAMVACYDREIARQILDGFIETELPKLAGGGGGRETSFLLESLLRSAAFIAPYHTGSLIGQLTGPGESSDHSPRNLGRLAFAGVLATPPGKERQRLLERSFLNLWTIDSEEDF